MAQVLGGKTEGSGRRVPMEVLCFGMPRTGTLSLRDALKELGYNGVYHMDENMKHPDHWNTWGKAYRAKFKGEGTPFTKKDWDEFLGDYMAVTDVPCMNFWEDLLEAYPDAKVILTIRDADSWHKSISNTIWQMAEWLCVPTSNPVRKLLRTTLPSKMDMFVTMIEVTFGMDFPENGRQAFHEHNAAVQKIVPKERLLVMHVKEGWEPLCKFLDKPVPPKAFPNVNDTVAFRKNFGRNMLIFDLISGLKLATIFGAIGAVAYGAQKYYWRR